MNIKPNTILPMSSKIQGASSEPLKLCGGIIVEISGVSESGKTVSTLQLMYVSESVTIVDVF